MTIIVTLEHKDGVVLAIDSSLMLFSFFNKSYFFINAATGRLNKVTHLDMYIKLR